VTAMGRKQAFTNGRFGSLAGPVAVSPTDHLLGRAKLTDGRLPARYHMRSGCLPVKRQPQPGVSINRAPLGTPPSTKTFKNHAL